MPSPLTIIVAYYNQPQMIEVWWDYVMAYGDEICSNILFIFVDDASPNHPISVPQAVVDRVGVSVFRVDQNIPWNQPGARNLAMKNATGWVLATDPDHVPSEDLIHKLLACDFQRGHFYHPARHRNLRKEPIKIPPTNVFVVHAEDYWAAGGYDEDFCGRKGFSDLMLLSTMTEGCKFTQEWLGREFSIDCYCEVIRLRKGGRGVEGIGQEWEGHLENPDAAVTSLNRNMRENKQLRGEKLTRARQIGWPEYIKEQRPVRFPWHPVEVS